MGIVGLYPENQATARRRPAGCCASRREDGCWDWPKKPLSDVISQQQKKDSKNGRADQIGRRAFSFYALGMVQKPAQHWGNRVRHLMDIAQGRGESTSPSSGVAVPVGDRIDCLVIV